MFGDDLLIAGVRIRKSGSRRQEATEVIPPGISRHEALEVGNSVFYALVTVIMDCFHSVMKYKGFHMAEHITTTHMHAHRHVM